MEHMRSAIDTTHTLHLHQANRMGSHGSQFSPEAPARNKLLIRHPGRPVFPNFKPLEMADRSEIEAFTRQFEPYSDFCFSVLTFYNCDGHTGWCWLNGNLVMRFSDSFGPGIFLTFLGTEQAAATASALINYANEMNYAPALSGGFQKCP